MEDDFTIQQTSFILYWITKYSILPLVDGGIPMSSIFHENKIEGQVKLILLVEDDEAIRTALRLGLSEAGFQIMEAETLEEGRRVWRQSVDLILLDLGLPDGDGFCLCEEVCQAGGPPVIILTAQDDEQDIIRGLNLGADDYVTKPFKFGVLLSRIGAVLRRSRSVAAGDGARTFNHDTLVCGPVRLTKSRTEAAVDGVALHLTAGEYRLLEYLMENKNRTLTRAMILGELWDREGNYVEDNALTVLMRRLREKLGSEGQRIIKTVRGVGYQVEDDYEN